MKLRRALVLLCSIATLLTQGWALAAAPLMFEAAPLHVAPAAHSGGDAVDKPCHGDVASQALPDCCKGHGLDHGGDARCDCPAMSGHGSAPAGEAARLELPAHAPYRADPATPHAPTLADPPALRPPIAALF